MGSGDLSIRFLDLLDKQAFHEFTGRLSFGGMSIEGVSALDEDELVEGVHFFITAIGDETTIKI